MNLDGLGCVVLGNADHRIAPRRVGTVDDEPISRPQGPPVNLLLFGKPIDNLDPASEALVVRLSRSP
jgi:hypothetical protein